MSRGSIAVRARELIGQGCEARNITILQGSVGENHIHLLLSCPLSMAPNKILQYLKGRSSRLLQDEFSELKKILRSAFVGGRFCATVENYKKLYCKFNEGNDEIFRIEK